MWLSKRGHPHVTHNFGGWDSGTWGSFGITWISCRNFARDNSKKPRGHVCQSRLLRGHNRPQMGHIWDKCKDHGRGLGGCRRYPRYRGCCHGCGHGGLWPPRPETNVCLKLVCLKKLWFSLTQESNTLNCDTVYNITLPSHIYS